MGFFKDYMVGRAMAQNPEILKRQWAQEDARQQAEARGQTMASLMNIEDPMERANIMIGSDDPQMQQIGGQLLKQQMSPQSMTDLQLYLQDPQRHAAYHKSKQQGQMYAPTDSMQNYRMRQGLVKQFGEGSPQVKAWDAERKTGRVIDLGDRWYDTASGQYINKRLAPKDQPQNIREATEAEERTKREVAEEFDRKAAWPKARNSYQKFQRVHENQTRKINKARRLISPMSASFGGTLISQLPGTEARNVQRLLESLQARLAFTELQNMRDASPTGGAVGQLTDKEREALSAAVTPVFQDQTVNDLLENLDELERYMGQLKTETEAAWNEDWADYGRRRQAVRSGERQQNSNEYAPSGVRWAE